MFISNPALNNLVLPRPRDSGQEKYHNWSALADLSYRSPLHLIHLQLFLTFVAVKLKCICMLYTGYVKKNIFVFKPFTV